MERKLRAGIIGCGEIAFKKHMSSLAKLESVEIAAFCSGREENAVRAKNQFGSPDARVYTSYQALLDDPTIDFVHICTPNKSHADITVYALEAGKHVMCEKPMAITPQDGRRMVDTARRTGKKLTVAYQSRYRADSEYLKMACERGDLGEIYFAKAHAVRRRAVPTWGVFLNQEEQGGGPLIDIGTHALDLTLWMMDNYKPRYVVGNSYHKLGLRKNEANAWGPWDPEKFTVEDSAFGFITMENGATIILESSWALNTLDEGEGMTTLCGTEGGADMRDGLRLNGVEFSKMYIKKPSLNAGGADFFNGRTETAADREVRLWVECILNDTEPRVKPEQALTVTEILDAIYESSRTGQPVYFK